MIIMRKADIVRQYNNNNSNNNNSAQGSVMSDSVTPCIAAHQAPWDSSGKSTGVGCCFLLQGIFPTQGSNPHLLRWQEDSLPLSHVGSPITTSAA